MKLVKIKKEFKPNVNPEGNQVQNKDVLLGDSLNSLNNVNNDYNYDFGSTHANQLKDNVIKNETKLIGACLSTAFKTIIKFIFIFLIGYFVVEFSGFDLFKAGEYSKEVFNEELNKAIMVMGISLFVLCFFVKGFINGSIKSVFKRKYLNKVNVYVYDVFVVIFNILSYVGVSVLYFYLIDVYYERLSNWKEAGRVLEDVNIEILNYLKYGIVVIVAIFIAFNVLRSLSIVHSKNKYVFEDEI